ncbi:MAG: gliding motility lipoprotein GldD [Bacteroidales bacterium]|nr:gliding motility lipoprotein GldD [Bacteroidales bacterium]HOY39611.1 gliding motility lipoprotein GldD [Bacteroidales bacterium]HQP04919.1 gliding motility lipoprotein GldD [Bacteroidales bacterium]
MKTSSILLSVAIIALLFASSCKKHYAPRPYGYFRIDFPEKDYKTSDTTFPYSFEMPSYSFMQADTIKLNWANLVFPLNHAIIYLTYKELNNDFETHMEESREFVYKHTVKADAIEESVFVNEDEKVYGILYDIKGNAASSVQFFVTDSTRHFLRGSLYFDCPPNKDSLDPVISFIRTDIVHIMETLKWAK